MLIYRSSISVITISVNQLSQSTMNYVSIVDVHIRYVLNTASNYSYIFVITTLLISVLAYHVLYYVKYRYIMIDTKQLIC